MKKRGVFVLTFIVLISLAGFAFASVPENSLHLNIQTLNSTGGIATGSFKFEFNISNSDNCAGIIYTNFSTLTTDSRGIISYYLDNVNLNFSEQYWLCYYRDGILINNSKIAKSPYAFRSFNITLSGIEADSNFNMKNYNLTTTGTGFFSYLGSLASRITTLFIQNIDFTGNINGSGNINTTANITADTFFGRWNGSSLLASGNASWNQSFANSLFAPNTTAGIQWLINGTNIAFGNTDFNNGWLNGGASIIGGNLFAQTVYVYNISSLSVNNLFINGSSFPSFDNTFDLGNSSLRWQDLFLSGQIYSNGTADNYFLGNLGIGTASPGYPLHIYEVGQVSTNIPIDVATVEIGLITGGTPIGYGPAILFKDGPPAYSSFMARIASPYESDGGTNYFGALSFYTNPVLGTTDTLVERMRITYLGNVGIGTSTPSQMLDVRGRGNFSGILYYNNQTPITALNSTTASIGNLYNITASMIANLSISQNTYYSDEIYINKNSSKGFNFNEAKLNSSIDTKISETVQTYRPFNVTTLVGNTVQGNITSIIYADGNTYNITEVAATPGWNIRIDFVNVISFTSLEIYENYSGATVHNPNVEIWNYNTGLWVTLGEFTDQDIFVYSSYVIPSSTNYISEGIVRTRLYHDDAGIGAHQFKLDYISLKFSTGGVSSALTGSGAAKNIAKWITGTSLGYVNETQLNVNSSTFWIGNTTLNIENLYNVTASMIANLSISQLGGGSGDFSFSDFAASFVLNSTILNNTKNIGNLFNVTASMIANLSISQAELVNYWGSNGSNIYNATAYIGIGTLTPNFLLEIAKNAKAMNISGQLYVNSSNVWTNNSITVGNGQIVTTYNSFGASPTPGSADMTNVNDVYIKEDLEVDGTFYLTGGYGSIVSGDVAENLQTIRGRQNTICEGQKALGKTGCIINSTADLSYGDVVCIDPKYGQVIMICNQSNSKLVAGVVSNTSVMQMGNNPMYAYPIAVAGIVWTKVSNGNGIINPGDFLVSSLKEGYAMKAPDNPQIGTILGKAFDYCDYRRKECIIPMFVALS